MLPKEGKGIPDSVSRIDVLKGFDPMKGIATVLIASAVLMTACPVFGCTGFAVYGGQPVYGMNFDYPATEIRLMIEEGDGTDYFTMQMQQESGFLPTVGMNDKGLFATTQMQYPEQTGQSSRGADELFFHELFGCIRSLGTVADVLEFVGDKRLRHWSGVTLHSLMADADGGAMIAEAGRERNEFLPMDGGFIVMTNFKNSDFKDKELTQIYGAGADRYAAAYRYIGENIEDFGIDQAFEALRLTTQEGSYPTLCSMVFAPEEQSVYAVFHRDFDRVWKVSIPDGTVETYRGFAQDMKCGIPGDGVTASDLMEGNLAACEPYDGPEETDAGAVEADTGTGETGAEEAGADNPVSGWYWAVVVLAAALILGIGVLVRNKRKAS